MSQPVPSPPLCAITTTSTRARQHTGEPGSIESNGGYAVILDPDTYVCPEHQADLTAQVQEALEDDDTPLAYKRPTLLRRGRSGPRPFRGDRHLPRHSGQRSAPTGLRRDPSPVTGPVSPLSPADRAWADLGAELTRAESLARVDAVGDRASPPSPSSACC